MANIWNVRNVDPTTRRIAVELSQQFGLTCAAFLAKAVDHLERAGPSNVPYFSDPSFYNDLLDLRNITVRNLKILSRGLTATGSKVLVLGQEDFLTRQILQRSTGCIELDFWCYPSGICPAAVTAAKDLNAEGDTSAHYDLIFARRPLNTFLSDAQGKRFLQFVARLLNPGGRLIGSFWQVSSAKYTALSMAHLDRLDQQYSRMIAAALGAGIPAIITLPVRNETEFIGRSPFSHAIIDTARLAPSAGTAHEIALRLNVETFLTKSRAVIPTYIVFNKPATQIARDYLSGKKTLTREDALAVCGFVRRRKEASLLPAPDGILASREKLFDDPFVIGPGACPWSGWPGYALEQNFGKLEMSVSGKRCLVIGKPRRVESIFDFLLSGSPALSHHFALREQSATSNEDVVEDQRIDVLDENFFENIGAGYNNREYDLIVIDVGMDWVNYFLHKTVRIVKAPGYIAFFIRQQDMTAWMERRLTQNAKITVPHLKGQFVTICNWLSSIEGVTVFPPRKVHSDTGKPEYLGIAHILD